MDGEEGGVSFGRSYLRKEVGKSHIHLYQCKTKASKTNEGQIEKSVRNAQWEAEQDRNTELCCKV